MMRLRCPDESGETPQAVVKQHGKSHRHRRYGIDPGAREWRSVAAAVKAMAAGGDHQRAVLILLQSWKQQKQRQTLLLLLRPLTVRLLLPGQRRARKPLRERSACPWQSDFEVPLQRL